MKKLISILMVLTLTFSLSMQVSAATFKASGDIKIPTSVSYKDLKHFVDVVAQVRNKEVVLINATNYNGDNTTWLARIGIANGGGSYVYDDYVITTCPYGHDPVTNTITTLPFANVDEGNAMYGRAWYYFGLFDDSTHNSCGFGIAERIKRWSAWEDMSFTGTSQRGISYTGNYKEACSNNFLDEHIALS